MAKRFSVVVFAVFLLATLVSCGKDKGTNSSNRGTWQITIGSDKTDNGYSVVAAGNGDYVLAGQTNGSGNGDYDMYIVRIDSLGNVLWEATSGTANAEVARSIERTPDGGFLALGRTTQPGGVQGDLFITKCSGSGSILWNKSIDSGEGEDGFSVRADPNGGYLLAGSSGISIHANFYIVRIDEQGSQVWDRKIPVLSLGSATGTLVQATGESQIAGWGLDLSNGGWTNMILLSLDAEGNVVRSGSYGGAKDEYCNAVTRTADAGFLLVGWTTSTGAGGQDVYVVKVDADGNAVWSKSYGGAASDGASAVTATPDGGYVIAGWTESMGAGDVDLYLIKIDGDGTLLWQRTFGGPDPDRAQAITVADDGGLIVVGSTQSMGAGDWDIYVVKTNANGEL